MTSFKKRILFHQCDPAGILFFAEIFPIAHSVLEEFLNSIGAVEEYFGLKTYGFPIRSANANYLKPLKHNEEITVDMSVKEIGKSSFQLAYQIFNIRYELAAEVTITHVCVKMKTFKKALLTQHMKAILQEI
jgi:YbgC/YbaW family acyl-CoA thioester hydrolase